MRWRTETEDERRKRKQLWQRKFAWWPTRCYRIKEVELNLNIRLRRYYEMYDCTVWWEHVYVSRKGGSAYAQVFVTLPYYISEASKKYPDGLQ